MRRARSSAGARRDRCPRPLQHCAFGWDHSTPLVRAVGRTTVPRSGRLVAGRNLLGRRTRGPAGPSRLELRNGENRPARQGGYPRRTPPPDDGRTRRSRRGGKGLSSRARRGFWVSPNGPPPRLDLVLLGLGTDAHTASLFPHSAALRESTRWVVPNDAPGLATPRLTLTPVIINRAAVVMFLVAGQGQGTADGRGA